ncbi:MAG TPA: DUF6406 domain-containing protein [Streptosporangiaceae bacterium]|jgi:hypothetical protein
MGVGTQVHVGNGSTFDREGLSFGGFDMFPAGDGEPAQVVISVWEQDTDSVHFELSLGESFEFAGQTWRLDEIDDKSRRWYATLTRVA